MKVACPHCHARVRIQPPDEPKPAFNPPEQLEFQSWQSPLHPTARHRLHSDRIGAAGKKTNFGGNVGIWIIVAVVAILTAIGLAISLALFLFGAANNNEQENGGLVSFLNPFSENLSGSISLEDARRVAEEYLSIIGQDTPLSQVALIDRNAIALRATRDFDLTDSERKTIIRELTNEPQLINNFVLTEGDDFGPGARYDVVNLRVVNHETRALVRVFNNSQFRYDDLIFGRDELGKVRIADVFLISEGESISKLLHRNLLEFSIEKGRPFVLRFKRREADYADSLAKLSAIEVTAESNPLLALEGLEKLPKSVQRRKDIMLFRVRLTQPMSREIHIKSHDAFQRAYEDDCSGLIQAIEYYRLLENSDRVIQSIERLNRFVGNDSVLTLMKADAYVMAENISDANHAFEKALKETPSIMEPYFFFIAQSIEAEEFDDAIGWIIEYEAKFPNQNSHMESIKGFQHFKTSQTYLDWRSGD